MNDNIDRLRKKANSLPLLPGVYLMKNKEGKIIYIGKAKALKNRVTSYFRSNASHNEKVRKMVSKVYDFDFIVTRAVSRLNILLEISLPFLKTNGYLICYKGIKYQEEINDSSMALKILNSTIEEVKKETLPFLNEERFNIIIKKNKEIDKKYPRLYSIIKKRPL